MRLVVHKYSQIHKKATFAVHGFSDVGWAPVSGNSSTGGGFGISVGLGNVLGVLFMLRLN